MRESLFWWECNFYHLLYNCSDVIGCFEALAFSVMRIFDAIPAFGHGCYSQIKSDYIRIIPPIIRVIAGQGIAIWMD